MSGPDIIRLLIECGFRASFPLAVAWAVTRLSSRSSAATRHFIWAYAVGIALLLPLPTIVTPRWNVATPEPITRLASAAHIKAGASTIPSVATTESIGVDKTDKPKARRANGLTPWKIATWIWITGAVVVFCYGLMGHFAAWRLYRTTRSIEDSWIKYIYRRGGTGYDD